MSTSLGHISIRKMPVEDSFSRFFVIDFSWPYHLCNNRVEVSRSEGLQVSAITETTEDKTNDNAFSLFLVEMDKLSSWIRDKDFSQFRSNILSISALSECVF